MAKPTVLLIHGMGTHPLDNMTREFKSGITAAAKGFGIEGFDIDEHMRIVEYNYSDTLDEIRTQLSENANEILDQFPDGIPAKPIIEKLLKFQADFSEDEMLYTHWLDVALYCTFYGNKLQVELATKLNYLFGDVGVGDIHVVAHSLGTALLHDTIDKFYKNPDPGEDAGDIPHLRAGQHNLKTLWTIANVSNLVRIVNDQTEIGDTMVKAGPDGCTDAHYNVYHTLDPFTWFYSYDKDSNPIELGDHFETHVVRKKNTHSFEEYIQSPEVAKWMITEMLSFLEPTEEARYEAYETAHKSKAPEGIAEQIAGNVAGLKNGATENPIETLKDLFNNLKAFKDAVDAIWNDDE